MASVGLGEEARLKTLAGSNGQKRTSSLVLFIALCTLSPSLFIRILQASKKITRTVPKHPLSSAKASNGCGDVLICRVWRFPLLDSFQNIANIYHCSSSISSAECWRWAATQIASFFSLFLHLFLLAVGIVWLFIYRHIAAMGGERVR